MIKTMYVVMVFVFLSCNNEMKFDKEKWNQFDEPTIPSIYRKMMLNDLLTNYTLVGLEFSQLLGLLGEPSCQESNKISYMIKEEYGSGIDLKYIESLEFQLTNDSIVQSFEILKWEK